MERETRIPKAAFLRKVAKRLGRVRELPELLESGDVQHLKRRERKKMADDLELVMSNVEDILTDLLDEDVIALIG